MESKVSIRTPCPAPQCPGDPDLRPVVPSSVEGGSETQCSPGGGGLGVQTEERKPAHLCPPQPTLAPGWPAQVPTTGPSRGVSAKCCQKGATHQGSCPLSRGQGATHSTHSPSQFRPRYSSGPGPCWAAPRQAGGVGRGGGRPPGAGCGFSPARSQGSKPQADQAGLGIGSVDVKDAMPRPLGPRV